MKKITIQDIEAFEHLYRINLINSCTGYKSANLLATRSQDGFENVAVFSSITHLGSNPPLLGFVLRPTTVPRNTFENIKTTQVFTVNSIHKDIIEDAHHTSAKYDGAISEFDKTHLQAEYKDDFHAPFVKNANVQLACRYANEYFIEENQCILIVAKIEAIYLADGLLQEDGFIHLEKAKSVTATGLDGYALPTLIHRFPYARPKPE